MAEQHQQMQQQHQAQHITAQILNVQGGVATLDDSVPVQIMMPAGVVMEQHHQVQQEQQIQVPQHVQEMQEVIQEAVGSATTQVVQEDPKLTNKKELSKQWKSLCKRAKQWCSMHDDSVPNFVMMYLDENRLVWEGPDHMESFISDESVISAFLRTAALSESLIGMEKRGVDEMQDVAPRPAKKQKKAETPSTSKKGMTDDEVIASILEKPEAVPESAAGDEGAGADGDDSDGDNVPSQTTDTDQPSQSTSEGPTQSGEGDVLSQVIESVIKDWAPGQGPPPTSQEGEEETGDAKKKFRRPLRMRRKRKPHYIVHTSAGTFEIVHTIKASGVHKKSGAAVRLRVRRAGQEKQMFTCEICGKTLSRNNMAAHLRIHRHDFKFFCDVCQKGFYTKKDMGVHYRIHTGEKPYSCPICCKAFRQKSKVTEHMLTHSHEKKHICEYCSQKFARRSDLKCHIRLHTGERPYICNQCGKKFAQPGNYSAHLRTHSKQTFVCEFCAKSYASMGGLKEHLRVHGDKKHPQQMHAQQQVHQETQQHQMVELELHNPLLQPQHQQLVQQHQVQGVQGVQYTLEQQPDNTYTFHQQPQASQGMLVTQDGQTIMSQGQPTVVSFPQDQLTQSVVIDHQGGQQAVQAGQVVLIEQGNQQTRIVMQ